MATPIDSIWILKPATTTADDPNFKLMFKNVYALPNEIDPTKFQIKVKRIPTSGGDTVDNVGGKLFSSILGLGGPEQQRENNLDPDIRHCGQDSYHARVSGYRCRQ